ncbi:MAG: hypothetical protein IJT05_06280 [Lachnospiraceae bacterium]|nr:hypothetical protein [Lachnospiraceae bacterium]
MKKFFVIIGVAAIFTGILCFAILREKSNAPLLYSENLDRVIVRTGEREFTLHDLAFYIGFQENKVNEQALIYDPAHPSNWWNTHTNGKFLKTEALESAIDMMLHDWYYSKDADAEGFALTEEEQRFVESAASDYFWDLGEDGLKALGLTPEDVNGVCERIALSEKRMDELARESGLDRAVYESGGKVWEEEKAALNPVIDKDLLRRIPMGNITTVRRSD